MSITAEKNGRILTFYSFKGGSGRTMALANEAVLLARAGLGFAGNRVLVMDWDLEAPGLHEFFKENLPEGHETSAGVIDLFLQANEQYPEGIKAPPAVAVHIKAFFEKSAIRLKQKKAAPEQPEAERPTLSEDIWLLKAGLFDEHYSVNVQTFDWRGFFSRNHAFFPLLISYLEKTYDYVLIDSRTGLTDSGGICTSILPEVLVTVFTPTNQGLRVTEVAERAVNYRKSSDDLRPLVVYPLASRIDTSAEKLNNQWKAIYIPRFEQLFKNVYHLKECDLSKYFGDIEVHYVTDLAYGESVAVMNNSDTVNTYELPARYNKLARLIVGEYFPWEMPDLTEPAQLLTAAAHVIFAEQLAANKEYKRAERHFEKALQLETEQLSKHFHYTAFARYFERRGELEEAESVYDDLVREIPLPISFMALLEFLLNSKKDYEKAKIAAETSLQQDRLSTRMLLLYAEVLTKLRRVEEAEKVYLDAIEIDPKEIGRYASFLRDIKKDFKKSEELFRKLAEDDPDDPEVWQVNLAQVLLLQGKKEEAETLIQSILFQKDAPVTAHVLCLIWFLRLAYSPDWYKRAMNELQQLLKNGVRWPNKNFDADIEAATRAQHPHLEEIKKMAAQISNPDPIED
jgi:MinD-like ATPase involved in chromosome partitioning or flagellar assembly/Tfp pilus assembly protein PilF